MNKRGWSKLTRTRLRRHDRGQHKVMVVNKSPRGATIPTPPGLGLVAGVKVTDE